MNAIAFKNFRNFVEFPKLSINGVTILIGGNNAGKSTCIKAYRLLAQNLQNIINCTTRFNMHTMEDVEPLFDLSLICGDFGRALSKYATNDNIEFYLQIGYFDITIQISAMSKDAIFAEIQSILIKDIIDNCSWSWQKGKKDAEFTYTGQTLAQLARLKAKHISNILSSFQKREDQATIQKLNNILTITEQAIQSYQAMQSIFQYKTNCTPFVFGCGLKVVLDGETTTISTSQPKDVDSKLQFTWDGDTNIFEEFFQQTHKDLHDACGNEQITYFPAYEAPSESYFKIRNNKADINACDITKFYKMQKENPALTQWVRQRMKDLGIGKDFTIKLENSDFLHVTITNEHDINIPLADNGRGAVHLFMLLIRIAIYGADLLAPTIIESSHAPSYFIPNNKERFESICRLFIFEEPEQNLHPQLQSKLADLFNYVQCKQLSVLIETHSEYLVRRSQVIVAEKKYKDEQELIEKCPFKVYYIPKSEDGNPYNMEYKTNGIFKQTFGKGFFDEASNLAFELF